MSRILIYAPAHLPTMRCVRAHNPFLNISRDLFRWIRRRIWALQMPRDKDQSVNSLNPRPLKIIGTHFSARAARVFACFAPET
jgi:hypothetical protein